MSLPISQKDAIKAGNWLEKNFGEQIKQAIADTHWDLSVVQGIFCKETAYKVLLWIDDYSPDIILARCVFDLSGEPEFPNNPRSCFPKDRYDFRKKYGDNFLDLLVNEYNLTRAMPQPNFPKGYQSTDTPYLAKAYGIFQYDLQSVVNDRTFFEQKQWYSFEQCMNRLVKELNEKARLNLNLHGTIAAYNGAGIKAQQYADDVMEFRSFFV